MDAVPDGGVGWRRKLTPVLNEMGIIVLDPCNKPFLRAVDEGQCRDERREWRARGEFDKVAALMRPIRTDDLALVDRSDFLIVRIDRSVVACGSWEEVFLANRMKKPVLCFVEQGKAECPDWLFGTIPHQHIFSNIEDVIDFVRVVDGDPDFVDRTRRWRFFDFDKVYDPAVLGL